MPSDTPLSVHQELHTLVGIERYHNNIITTIISIIIIIVIITKIIIIIIIIISSRLLSCGVFSMVKDKVELVHGSRHNLIIMVINVRVRVMITIMVINSDQDADYNPAYLGGKVVDFQFRFLTLSSIRALQLLHSPVNNGLNMIMLSWWLSQLR